MFRHRQEGKIYCPGCGMEYELTSIQYPVKENGQEDCQKCGATVKKWSGTRDYTITPIKNTSE